MPISISQLVKNSRTFAIPLEGGEVNVTYDPSKMSAAYMQEIQERLEEDDPYAVANLFCAMVKGWDLVGPINEEGHNDFIADGKPIPLEPRYVAWIPTPFLMGILQAVGDDASPKSPQKNSVKR